MKIATNPNLRRYCSILGRRCRVLRKSLLLAVSLAGFCGAGHAQDYELAAPGTDLSAPAVHAGVTLFQNVRIFDGRNPQLSEPSNLLVEGNIIRRITSEPIPTDKYAKVHVIDGNGRVLMPGLIDAHWHAFMAAASMSILMTAPLSYVHLLAAHQAEATLMRGFTIRDLGGPVFVRSMRAS